MSKKRTLRFIGDVHNQYTAYLELTKGADYSFQVGDVGIDYSCLSKYLDPFRHVAIAGNHDCCYESSENYFKKHPFFLGDFGLHEFPGFPPIFYMRGAWSIDKQYRVAKELRTGEKTWYESEQLGYDSLCLAIELYKSSKPSIVVTHECPLSVVEHVTNPDFVRNFGFDDPVIKTDTNMALQQMLDFHSPKLWIFGHYHQEKQINKGNTEFRCIDTIRGNGKAFFDLEEGLIA